MPLVYSYMRFSSAKQADGNSIDRQTDYARQWAAERGMTLDESLSMKDERLSAFHGKHVTKGALGAFLKAIEGGRVPQGSVLIVENFDRLSRAEVNYAAAQMLQIVNAGITVVTAGDNGRVYNIESLAHNPMDLMYSIMVMSRAHEESKLKSDRVRKAIYSKCEAWVDGKMRKGRIGAGKDPAWVRWTGKDFELEPEIAEGVRFALSRYVEGYGAVRIIKELSDRGLRTPGQNIAANLEALVTKNPILFSGAKTMTVLGREFVLEGYYPALLTPEEYDRLILAIASRRQKPRAAGGKSDIPSLFSGLGIASCGKCGCWVTAQNQRQSWKGKQLLYRAIRCDTCRTASAKAGNVSHNAVVKAESVERAILNYCSDQMNIDALLAGDSRAADLRTEKLALLARIAELRTKLDRAAEAAFEADLPAVMLKRMSEMEVQVKQFEQRIAVIDAELPALAGKDNHASATEWNALREKALALDAGARMQCRKMVADAFSEIRFYFNGIVGSPAGSATLMLVSKAGVRRMLTINRKNGALIEGLEMVSPPDQGGLGLAA